MRKANVRAAGAAAVQCLFLLMLAVLVATAYAG